MKEKQNNISGGCEEYSSQTQRLTGIAPEDPERIVWEIHARECEECTDVLEGERELRDAFVALSDPGPAFVSARVLSRVRNNRTQPLRVRLREVSLGLAGTLAGVILGVVIAGSNVESVQADPLSEFEIYLEQLDSGFDDLTVDMLSGTQEDAS